MTKHFILITSLFSLVFIVSSAIFSFPDVFQLVFTPVRAAMEKQSPYRYLILHKEECPWLDATYPPLFYQIFTPYYVLLKEFGIFGSFLSQPCPVWPFITSPVVLLAIKLPYLFAHLLTAYSFSLLFSSRRKTWFFFWLFQPIPFFVSVFMGQFDAAVLLFLILGVLLLARIRIFSGAFALGVAGALKHVPFFVALPLLLLFKETKVRKLIVLLLLFLPYVVSLQFANFTEVRRFVFSFSENTKMLAAQLPLSGSWSLSLYLLLYLFGIWRLRDRYSEEPQKIAFITQAGLLLLLPYYIFTPWFLQRIVYVLPFVIIFVFSLKWKSWILHSINFLFFAWALFGFPGVLDSVLLRAVLPSADTIVPFAQRVGTVFSFSVQQLGNIVLTTLSSLFLYLFFLALQKKHSLYDERQVVVPTKKDFVLLGIPLVGYLLVILVNFFQ